jgi:hypothetical protein
MDFTAAPEGNIMKIEWPRGREKCFSIKEDVFSRQGRV